MVSTKAQAPMSDATIMETVQKELSSNNPRANGKSLLTRLATIADIIQQGAPLGLNAIFTHPELVTRALSTYFKSSQALLQHMQAVVSAVKSFRPKIAFAGPLKQWEDAVTKAKEEAHADRCKVEQLFSGDPLGATPKTIQGYVNDIMHMMAKLNVKNVEEVIADPTCFRPHLMDKCGSKGTEASHISRILGIFHRNPDLKRRHHAAYEVWMRASSEHNARTKREALCNAPSNPSQAENFVPMQEWHDQLKELEAAEDPHATMQASLRLVFLAYACTMPPKRAEVGGIRIF
jgi:hypothetical protein